MFVHDLYSTSNDSVMEYHRHVINISLLRCVFCLSFWILYWSHPGPTTGLGAWRQLWISLEPAYALMSEGSFEVIENQSFAYQIYLKVLFQVYDSNTVVSSGLCPSLPGVGASPPLHQRSECPGYDTGPGLCWELCQFPGTRKRRHLYHKIGLCISHSVNDIQINVTLEI